MSAYRCRPLEIATDLGTKRIDSLRTVRPAVPTLTDVPNGAPKRLQQIDEMRALTLHDLTPALHPPDKIELMPNEIPQLMALVRVARSFRLECFELRRKTIRFFGTCIARQLRQLAVTPVNRL